MRTLVTGGAGYIGAVVADALLKASHEVWVVDDLSRGHVEALSSSVHFQRVDLRDWAATRDAFARAKPEAVLHFAAHSQVGESFREPWKYLGESVTIGLNAMRAAVELGVRRFVLSSTANLYGSPRKIPITEEEDIRPGSPYGESKAALERALGWLERSHGLEWVALRYFNAAGATEDRGEDHDPETHLIPLVLQVAAGCRPYVDIFGLDYPTPDGSCVRDYIHVSDLADAHVRALESGRGAYNLGVGRGFSVLEVVETARHVTGHPIPATDGRRRPGDLPVLVAEASKARRELGWTAKFNDLSSIIESSWRWMLKHPQGFRGRQ